MSPRTATPAPTDPAMRRRLLLRVHPDQGGDEELFVWTTELLERVADGCSGCPGPDTSNRNHGSHRAGRPAPERVDFPNTADHEDLVERAWAMAMSGEVSQSYARLFELLRDCRTSPAHRRQERSGATYRQLAYIAHLAGMSASERAGWYEVAEAVPMSQRHAGYLIECLRGAAA